MSALPQESRAKPYQTPQLKIYGDITMVTGTGTTMGLTDDHNSGMNKTS